MARIIEDFDKDQSKTIEAPDTSVIQKFLEEEILGQPVAVEFWANAIHRVLSGAPKIGNGPLFVTLEAGPSGVGKTEVVKRAAEFLVAYSRQQGGRTSHLPLLRIDCAEYQRDHSVSKLLGSDPNYAGAEVTPRLAQTEVDRFSVDINGKKVTILLFDEIEKASERLSEVLLGALDNGIITTGKNEQTSVKDCIVVFTSNLGNVEIAKTEVGSFSGFLTSDVKSLTPEEKAHIRLKAIEERFPSEQLSRMGGKTNMMIFRELPKEVVTKILVGKLSKVEKVYAAQGFSLDLQVTIAGIDKLLALGYSAKQGIRPLETVIEQQIVSKLTTLKKGARTPVVIDVTDDELSLHIPSDVELQKSSIEAPLPVDINAAPPQARAPHASKNSQKKSSLAGPNIFGLINEKIIIGGPAPKKPVPAVIAQNGVNLYLIPEPDQNPQGLGLQMEIRGMEEYGIYLRSSVQDLLKRFSAWDVEQIVKALRDSTYRLHGDKRYVVGHEICIEGLATGFDDMDAVQIVEGNDPPFLRVAVNATKEQIHKGTQLWMEKAKAYYERKTGMGEKLGAAIQRFESLPVEVKFERLHEIQFRKDVPQSVIDTATLEFVEKVTQVLEDMLVKHPDRLTVLKGVKFSPQFRQYTGGVARILYRYQNDSREYEVWLSLDAEVDEVRRGVVQAVKEIEENRR